jgi:NADH dehydrogenase/NADH:ubiquinone oxidoreductase subunit G
MGVDVKEIDAVREMVNATEGDIIILLGAELSPAAQTVAAQFAHGHENQNVMFHPLPLHNNSVGAIDMMPGAKSVAAVAGAAKALYIGGSLPDASVLAGKDFVVVQELFETETTAHADVVLPAASFAEVDGTYTNNDGFVQRIRQTIEPLNQSKADWMAVSLIAREMGVDFGWQMSASAVFKELADTNTAYAGLRFPALKDESQPVQVKHAIHGKKDLSAELKSLHEKVAALPEGEKSHDTPPIGHILHKPGTMTGKTEQFHLLANGNPKPDDRLVSPLYSFNLDGTPREEKEVAAAI